MDCRLENMTAEEIFCAEAGITSEEEYDAYIDAMCAEQTANQPEVESYTSIEQALDEMYQDYLASEYLGRIDTVDYGKYDVAGWDIYNY